MPASPRLGDGKTKTKPVFRSRKRAKTLFWLGIACLLMIPQSIDTSSFGLTFFSAVLGVITLGCQGLCSLLRLLCSICAFFPLGMMSMAVVVSAFSMILVVRSFL